MKTHTPRTHRKITVNPPNPEYVALGIDKITDVDALKNRLVQANKQIDDWRSQVFELRKAGKATPAEIAELRTYAKGKQKEIDELVKQVHELRLRLAER